MSQNFFQMHGQAGLFATSGFVPHGFCLAWDPFLVWALVIAHSVIALSYYAIPVALVYFVLRQRNLKFNWMFLMFGIFIFACGTTHLISVLNIWQPVYRLDAALLALTAGVSLATAITLWQLVPQASSFIDSRTHAISELVTTNQKLSESLTLLDTHRVRVEQSEQQFRLTLGSAPIGLALVALDGSLITVNQSLCAMLGYSEAELMQRTFQDITHPDDLAADLEHVRELLGGHADRYSMEKRYLTKTGQIISIQLDVALLRDDQDQPRHFISQIQNITGRKQSEQALFESKQRLEQGMAELERKNREITVLAELSGILQACQSATEVAEPVCRFGELLFKDFSGALFLIDREQNYLEQIAVWGPHRAPAQVFAPEDCWALRRGQMRWTGLEDGLHCAHLNGAPFEAGLVLCMPLLAQGDTIGLLYLHADQVTPEALAVRRKLELEQLAALFVDRVGIAVANIKLRETLHLQSVRDMLTGLFNRRYLEAALPRELSAAQRESRPLSILMLDVDHFKHFNDVHGHMVGDEVLRLVGQLLRRLFRGADIACRYGGEEFSVVMPGATSAQAHAKAEILRVAIHQLELIHEGTRLRPITASIGFASFPEHADNAPALLIAADDALYCAKRAGRNCVTGAVTASDFTIPSRNAGSAKSKILASTVEAPIIILG